MDASLDFTPKHDFLICIDSDGCVFDSMDLKHKECFVPALINVWNLQFVSRYAREAWEYVNLYSHMRGLNRYITLVKTLTLLAERKEARERGFVCPNLSLLQHWIDTSPALSLSALKKTCEENGHSEPVLEQTLAWSEEVDRSIAHIVRGAMCFPHVKETLEMFREYADIVIVSTTPKEAITREWREHDLLKYVTYICGQEEGSKEVCIRKANAGRYQNDHVLMMGDAPGDQKAAEANQVLFYPVIPGKETESWEQAASEAVEQVRACTYAGKAMEKALEAFDKALLKTPGWV